MMGMKGGILQLVSQVLFFFSLMKRNKNQGQQKKAKQSLFLTFCLDTKRKTKNLIQYKKEYALYSFYKY